MRPQERKGCLLRSPQLLFDILARGQYAFTYDQMPMQMNSMDFKKRINLVKSGANLLYRRPKAWSMPLHMQFELTNYCNLSCPVCPAGTGTVRRKPQAMDVSLFQRVMEEVGPYLLTLSLWAWGEPLLHPRLYDILELLYPYDIITLLSTNGQRLNDERVIQALATYPPTNLICAIDGLSDETNSQYRSGARLEKVLLGVRRLAEIKESLGMQLPVLHMRFIAMKHNQHELPHIVEFASQNRFDLLTVRTLSIIDVESPDQRHYHLIPDDPSLRAYRYTGQNRLEKQDYICLQPFWFPTLFADGTVVACEQDFNAQQPLGQVDEGTSFHDVWLSSRTRQRRKAIRDQPTRFSFCRHCPYRDRDVTDCSIQAHFLNETIDYDDLTGKAKALQPAHLSE